MNGCVIPQTPIAVDFWKIRECPHARIFFLTHLHGDHITGLTSSWSYPIYCSEITGKLLVQRYGVREELIHPLQVECATVIYLDLDHKEQMTVIAIDANHCPGAVMFIMEGYFGTILHTGDFRYHKDMIPDSVLSKYLGRIDLLYLDNTYCSQRCEFPTRSEATARIIKIIEDHPEDNVLIAMRNLGKEDLLCKIALHFQEWVSVPEKFYKTLEVLGAPDVFDCSGAKHRIQVVPFQIVSNTFVNRVNEDHSTIVILPTALFHGTDAHPYENNDKVFIVPYSDHSSYTELQEFVSHIKPRQIVPIVKGASRGPFGMSVANRADMSCFDKFISENWNSKIVVPRSVKAFMYGTSGKTANVERALKRKSHSSLNLVAKKKMKPGVSYNSPEKDITNLLKQSEYCIVSEQGRAESRDTCKTPETRRKLHFKKCGTNVESEIDDSKQVGVADLNSHENIILKSADRRNISKEETSGSISRLTAEAQTIGIAEKDKISDESVEYGLDVPISLGKVDKNAAFDKVLGIKTYSNYSLCLSRNHGNMIQKINTDKIMADVNETIYQMNGKSITKLTDQEKDVEFIEKHKLYEQSIHPHKPLLEGKNVKTQKKVLFTRNDKKKYKFAESSKPKDNIIIVEEEYKLSTCKKLPMRKKDATDKLVKKQATLKMFFSPRQGETVDEKATVTEEFQDDNDQNNFSEIYIAKKLCPFTESITELTRSNTECLSYLHERAQEEEVELILHEHESELNCVDSINAERKQQVHNSVEDSVEVTGDNVIRYYKSVVTDGTITTCGKPQEPINIVNASSDKRDQNCNLVSGNEKIQQSQWLLDKKVEGYIYGKNICRKCELEAFEDAFNHFEEMETETSDTIEPEHAPKRFDRNTIQRYFDKVIGTTNM